VVRGGIKSVNEVMLFSGMNTQHSFHLILFSKGIFNPSAIIIGIDPRARESQILIVEGPVPRGHKEKRVLDKIVE